MISLVAKPCSLEGVKSRQQQSGLSSLSSSEPRWPEDAHVTMLTQKAANSLARMGQVEEPLQVHIRVKNRISGPEFDMSNHTSRASSRFFAVFQRYCTLPNPKHRLIRPDPRFHSQRQRHAAHAFERCRYASTSTAPLREESLCPRNHYDLFPSSLPSGPPPNGSFHINSATLRKEFLQLQAKAHPDRHQGPDKAKAEAASARINDAYKTLLNPLARARYLLSLWGLEMSEDESIAGSTSGMEGASMDAGLLMDVMEVREGIEEAGSREEIEEKKAENNRRKKASEDRLDEMFRAGDIEAARRETIKLGYWVNVGTALDGWEKVGDGSTSEHD